MPSFKDGIIEGYWNPVAPELPPVPCTMCGKPIPEGAIVLQSIPTALAMCEPCLHEAELVAEMLRREREE